MGRPDHIFVSRHRKAWLDHQTATSSRHYWLSTLPVDLAADIKREFSRLGIFAKVSTVRVFLHQWLDINGVELVVSYENDPTGPARAAKAAAVVAKYLPTLEAFRARNPAVVPRLLCVEEPSVRYNRRAFNRMNGAQQAEYERKLATTKITWAYGDATCFINIPYSLAEVLRDREGLPVENLKISC